MDSKRLIEIIGDTMSLTKLVDMNRDICELKNILYIIVMLKSKIKKGAIAETVNIQISPLNVKYKTNFRCEKDEDFEVVLNEVIDYIEKKLMQEGMEKIAEKLVKKGIKNANVN